MSLTFYCYFFFFDLNQYHKFDTKVINHISCLCIYFLILLFIDIIL
jgi:hypothetical protein